MQSGKHYVYISKYLIVEVIQETIAQEVCPETGQG